MLNFIVNALTNLLGKFQLLIAGYVSGKILIVAAAVTAYLVLIAGLNSAFNIALSSIALTMPSEFSWSLGLLPDNVPLCISTVLVARATVFALNVKWQVVNIRAGV